MSPSDWASTLPSAALVLVVVAIGMGRIVSHARLVDQYESVRADREAWRQTALVEREMVEHLSALAPVPSPATSTTAATCIHRNNVIVRISTDEIVALWCPDCEHTTYDSRWMEHDLVDEEKRVVRTEAVQQASGSQPLFTSWLNEYGEWRAVSARCDFCDQPLHTASDRRLHLNVCTPERVTGATSQTP